MSKGTQITLVKDPNGLFHPYNEIDYEAAKKIPVGEDNVFKLQRIRNGKHHRKYFAMIKCGFDNQNEFEDIEVFRKVMQMRAGYYNYVKTDRGELYIPKSISYAELDQTQFSDLYDKVFQQIQRLIGMTKKDVELFESELAAFA